MSTIEEFQKLNVANQKDQVSYTQTSFYKSGILSENAGLANPPAPELPYDFINFLAVAQWRDVDFLPITWEPALDSVGAGATAEIRQSLINLQLSLAFKRVHLERLCPGHYRNAIRALMSEVLALGHPVIRRHQNIIRLQGICWDVRPDKVWPVLVFKKSQYGDLKRFMMSEPGEQMSIKHRLKLARDIATAILSMHSYRKYSNYAVCVELG
jgi:hypothetical protein